ncbi:hypothetical protein MWU59_08505 [Flavobacteriaceae bacterium F08102]|nr:hypothetical protein [Flavobacteriaceae bacterium F08102]
MENAEFIRQIEQKNRDLNHQNFLVQTCISQSSLLPILIDNMIHNQENNTYFARILELVVKDTPTVLLEYLNEFSAVLPYIKVDSTARSCAKICEILLTHYEIKKDSRYRNALHPKHLELITSTCFDWKIKNYPVAVQAHAMYTLYLLGFTYSWIHSELTLLIQKKLPSGSTGYQNRGRKIIKAIATEKLYTL